MKNIATSIVLVTSLLCPFNNTASDSNLIYLDEPVIVAVGYGTDSICLEYNIEHKWNVEKEAEALFGKMREATAEEYEHIQKYIDSISIPTGVDFWN